MKDIPVVTKNQTDRRLQNEMGLNPFASTNSSSRMQMFSNHISQRLVISGVTPKKIMTGMEVEFGKYTLANKMLENGRIIKAIHRYPENNFIKDGFQLSPQTVALYENEDGEIGLIDLEWYCSLHPDFGFEYKKCEGLAKLSSGNIIPKDTVFLDTPCKDGDMYNYGIELNIAFMSHPCVSEDGIGISRDVLDRLQYRVYEKRVVEWGKKDYPLNLYGDDDNYKPFPDIGEYINTSNKGLLMALREYDPLMVAIDQSKKALRHVDVVFDKCVYVSGNGGRIVDVKVYHQPPVKGDVICDEMMAQPIRYRDAQLAFRQEALDTYNDLKRKRGDSLVLTPELQRFIIESMAILNKSPGDGRGNLKYIHKNTAMDEWRAEFVIEHIMTPNIGGKLTAIEGKVLPH